MRTKLQSLAGFSLACVLTCPAYAATLQDSAAGSSGSGYHLIKRVVLGGDEGWDYLTVDTDARRLYVTRGTHVLVLDVDSYAVIGDIPDTPGVHGVAVAPELGRGFTSNGRSDSVTIFDLKTLAPLGATKTGKGPDAILYDPFSRRVFAFDGRGMDATVIDAASGAFVGALSLDGKPEFAVSDGAGKVYVNLEDKSAVAVIDASTLAVRARWPLSPCEGPSGMAIDRRHRRLFVGCSNRLMAVVDADSGTVVATLPIGEGVDGDAFDPGTGLAFSSNGDGTLTVVQEDGPDRFRVIDNVPTMRGARTMALDPVLHTVFLVGAELRPPSRPTEERPHPRPGPRSGTVTLLVFGRGPEAPRK